jgi:polar amino acid transport system substrate-binding protein
MRKLLSGFWLGILCSFATLVWAADKPLRVGSAADTPPLAFQKEGKVVGMEADFARLLETQLGRPLQFQIMPATDLLPALQRGDIDLVMSGLVVTEARAQQVDFTQPYLQAGQMAIIRTEDVMRFRSPVSLVQGGFRVGSVANSAGTDYVRTQMSAATAVPCNHSEECLQALLSKRIDVFIDGANTSWLIATQPHYSALLSLYRPLTEESFAWAVKKDNSPLRERLNSALQAMQQTQMFEHILNRWIPVRVSGD